MCVCFVWLYGKEKIERRLRLGETRPLGDDGGCVLSAVGIGVCVCLSRDTPEREIRELEDSLSKWDVDG